MQLMRQRPLAWFYLLAFGWAWTLELPILGLWHPPPGTLGDALRIIIPTLIGGPTLLTGQGF